MVSRRWWIELMNHFAASNLWRMKSFASAETPFFFRLDIRSLYARLMRRGGMFLSLSEMMKSVFGLGDDEVGDHVVLLRGELPLRPAWG